MIRPSWSRNALMLQSGPEEVSHAAVNAAHLISYQNKALF